MSDLQVHIIRGDNVQIPILEDGVTWKTERRGSPGELQFTVVKDEALGFQEGDPVRFFVDGKPVFFGFVFSKSRCSGLSFQEWAPSPGRGAGQGC